jgi:hypothetical protein
MFQVGLAQFDFFDINDTLDATARPTDRGERGSNKQRTALANVFKAESDILTVPLRAAGITSEQKRLGWLISDRLTSTPTADPSGTRARLLGKFVEEPVRFVVPSKETAKMITEGIIKTKLHVAACSGANATDDHGLLDGRPGFLVLAGPCQFGTAWAGLRLIPLIHSVVTIASAHRQGAIKSRNKHTNKHIQADRRPDT